MRGAPLTASKVSTRIWHGGQLAGGEQIQSLSGTRRSERRSPTTVGSCRHCFRTSLTQLVRESPSEAGQLVREASTAIEFKMPSVACEAPIADIDDSPIRICLQIEHEIDTTVVGAVPVAAAEDRLAFVPRRANLATCESKRYQDRVKDRRDILNLGAPVTDRIRVRDIRHASSLADVSVN